MSIQNIKAEALKQFAEKGYEGTSIKDITKVLGMTPPALYAHFMSKEELFLEIYKECFIGLMTGVKKIIEKDKNEDGYIILKDIFEYYLNFNSEHSPKTVFLFRNRIFPPNELKAKINHLVKDMYSEVQETIISIFADCIEKGTIKSIPVKEYHSSFYRLTNSYIFEIMVLDKSITREEMDNVWEFYWNSVKK